MAYGKELASNAARFFLQLLNASVIRHRWGPTVKIGKFVR